MRRDSLEELSASSCDTLLSRHARRNERNGTVQGLKTYSKTGQFAIRILLPHFVLCEYNCHVDRVSSGNILMCDEMASLLSLQCLKMLIYLHKRSVVVTTALNIMLSLRLIIVALNELKLSLDFIQIREIIP